MTAGPVPAADESTSRSLLSRVLVLAANGPSGRKIVQQALERGHRVVALTRNPDMHPFRHKHLVMIGGNASVPAVLDDASARCDQVISIISAPAEFKTTLWRTHQRRPPDSPDDEDGSVSVQRHLRPARENHRRAASGGVHLRINNGPRTTDCAPGRFDVSSAGRVGGEVQQIQPAAG
ncbi:NAD(P)H-binding protein [Arthrobacter sp. TMS1-12-1]